jgi:deoxycytidylate deaminase
MVSYFSISMRYLSGEEEKKALGYIAKAADVARSATCRRSKCGSIIVQLDDIIGSGFNSPPRGIEEQRRCSCSKASYHRKVTDKTCCVHAEQRAIMDALRKNPDKLPGSRLYFIRLDGNGEASKAGEPYCTICSKMALDVGISEFVLWNNKGVCVYDTKEYNLLSFNFGIN